MVEIIIHEKTKRASGLAGDEYRWWEVDLESRELFEHLMPMHNANSLTEDEIDKVKKLALAHGWAVTINKVK